MIHLLYPSNFAKLCFQFFLGRLLYPGEMTGADPGFFLGGGTLVSCSTSTPINHIVFLFFKNTSCIRKPQVISRGEGARTPCTLPLDPPLNEIAGSLDRWVTGSLDWWIDGSMDRWIITLKDRRIAGSVHRWIAGSLDLWISESVDQWIDRSMDRWIAWSLDRWIAGSLDRWIGGSLDH